MSLARVVPFLALMMLATDALAVEIMTWAKQPLPLKLEVGVERTLDFGVPVEVGAPAYLTNGRLRTQSTGGVIYWQANEAFETRRIQVKNTQTGQLMLFDVQAVSASKKPNVEPIRVVNDSTARSGSPSNAEASDSEVQALGPIGLIRFAAKQFYAPKRLSGAQPDITRIPMRLPARLTGLFSGRLNQKIESKPLAAWRSATDGLYVTAIRLSNVTQEPLELDYRDLTGDLLYASLQHGDLGPRSSPTDTTTLYLVTEHEPGASLGRGE